uniref:Uncharacterized protein n=1 Tax=Meloidogyne enterolobii TaxID=390850 RepID=A0A6V7VPY9_MELEN|nr:unnamed protein product [Meloidogyne enterolobii]
MFIWTRKNMLILTGIKLCSFLIWGLERFIFWINNKQRRQRRHEERIFAPDLRCTGRRARRPINRNDIGPPLPLHCVVKKDKVEVHEIELKELGVKEKNEVKRMEVKDENEKIKVKETRF